MGREIDRNRMFQSLGVYILGCRKKALGLVFLCKRLIHDGLN